MKIALVSPYDWAYPGGVNNHIQCLANEFIKKGHQVTIVAPSSKSAAELKNPNLVVIGRPLPVPLAGSYARVSVSFNCANTVREFLAENKFDVLHIHEPLFPALPLTVLRVSNMLTVGTFHAYAKRSRGYRAWRPLIKRWFRKLDGKIAVSKPAADLISKYYKGYFNIIPNGIDVAHFGGDVPPIEKYMDGKTNILFVGRMEKRKGLRYLLAAFATLKWEYPQLRLIVVGPGKLDPPSTSLLGERMMQDVEFVGPVSYADLPRYYRTADIFCSPAIGHESFGIVLLEAMAAGKPVIASNIPGYATLVRDGDQGLLVPPKDEAALAAAIVRLIDNSALRQAMGARGREFAKGFSWDQVAQRVMDYYVRLMEGRDPIRRIESA